jgi:DNA-binding response OmpR family regulator
MRSPTEARNEVILLADENERGRAWKHGVLRKAGYEVVEATTGPEALRLATAASPALVVLDVALPGLDGIEVCRRLRASPSISHVGVLETSATLVTGEDRVRGLEGGADAYLVEPCDAPLLVATVRAVLRMRRAERELGELLEAEHDARREAEVLSRRKDEHVASVAHELRTPLNAILGWARLLRDGKLDEAARAEALAVIERNARIQSEMIEELERGIRPSPLSK